MTEEQKRLATLYRELKDVEPRDLGPLMKRIDEQTAVVVVEMMKAPVDVLAEWRRRQAAIELPENHYLEVDAEHLEEERPV